MYATVGSLLFYLPGQALAFSGIGNGSTTYPYRITTCAQFQEIANNTSADYALMNDIDCTGVSWTGIPTYSGIFDGRNHTISNLTAIGVPSAGGIFDSTTDATIKNLKITGLTITTGGGADTGGLVGEINGGLISNVSVSGTITGGNSAGGVVGVINGGTVANSSFTGNVSVDDGWGGGLAGDLINGTISNSYANVTVTGTDGGGLVGQIFATGGNSTNLTNSYVLGNVNFGGGNVNRGGITERVVQDAGSTVTLSNNVVAATMHGGSVLYTSLYSGTPTVSNNYFDATVVGSSTACAQGSPISGCTAVNTDGTDGSHFQNTTAVAPLNGWDFTNTWLQNSGYPTLRDATIAPLANPTIPGTASNLQASAGTPKSTVDLTWNAANDGGSDVTYSALYRDITAGDVSFTTYGTTTGATNLAVTGLALHHQYQFKISAVNAVGSGGTTSPVTFTTTSDNSAVITTCAQLQAIDDNLSGSYTLGSNVDCSGSASWNSGAGFSPIGLADGFGATFTGSLDGQGHTITGLTINRGSSSNAGLFLNANHATIHDLGLTNCSVTGQADAGTLAADANDTNIYNVQADGDSATSTDSFSFNTGGLIGADTGDSGSYYLHSSYFTGNVNGHINTGGLVGYVSFISIQSSYSSGTVAGTYAVGGLIGSFQDFWGLTSVYSHANVTASNDDAGGLVGQLGDGFHGAPFIESAYASGSVTSNGDSAGGLVGLDIGNIGDSFAAGPVSAPHASSMGGFVGTYNSGSSADNVYDAIRTGQSSAAGSGTISDVTAVDTSGSPNSTYFFNNLSSAPMLVWDPSSWVVKASNFPVFARTPHNVTSVSTQPTAISIKASWLAASDSDTPDITSYTLKYRPSDLPSGWGTISVPAGATNSYTITGLVPNTSYDISVITNTSSGSSSGTTVTSTTLSLPILSKIGSGPSSLTQNGAASAATPPASAASSSAGDTTNTAPQASDPSPIISSPTKSYNYPWVWISAMAAASLALGAYGVFHLSREHLIHGTKK